MGKPSFTVFVGIKKPFSDSDLSRLPDMLRKAYSPSVDFDPGEDVVMEGLEFESFDLGSDDTADPGPFAGFGVRIFGHWYDGGTSPFSADDVESIVSIWHVRDTVKALFEQWELSAPVGVFCFSGYNS